MYENRIEHAIVRVGGTRRPGGILIGLGLALIWLGVTAVAVEDTGSRPLLRMLDFLLDPAIMRAALISGLASLALAALVRLVSSIRRVAYRIDRSGVTTLGLLGERTEPWSHFGAIDRQTGGLLLIASPEAAAKAGARSVEVPVENSDVTIEELEALVARYRPDLISQRQGHRVRPAAGKMELDRVRGH
ncbi:MAG: hypothetical protein R3D33_12020 [Hyphomicrobiaceae bacterium]